MEIWELKLTGPMQAPDSLAAYFTTFGDIERSLRVSYSACASVDVVKSPQPHGGPTFTVTGIMPHGPNGEPFKHVYATRRLTVHDRVTHL